MTISVINTLLSLWLLWGVRCLKALLARVKFWWDRKPECLEKTLNVILRLTDIQSTRNNHRNGKNTWPQLCRPEGAQSGLFPDGHPSIHQPHLTGLNFGAQTGPFEATFFNPLTAEWALRALIDFTLSNARRFYSSKGNPLDGKGSRTSKMSQLTP